MPKSSFSDVARVVAIGDLHGNYGGFRKILLHAGLIDKRGHWIARNTHLVQLGDILGRGGEPGKIFKLLRQLEEEASELDSRVHVLLGNHEAMSMSGLLMYNTMEEFQDLTEQDFVEPLEAIGGQGGQSGESGPIRGIAPLKDWRPAPDAKFDRRMDMLGCREFRATLSPWGKVGKWLGRHDSAVIVNDSLFVHGGLNREHGCQPLDDLNDQIRRELGTFAPPDANRDLMLMRDGPQWNREFTLRPSDEKAGELAEVLDFHGCARMVVGHTPTSCIIPAQAGRIVPLYEEKLLCIDTGIGKSYGENLSALSLEGGGVTALYL
jgi:hypothetical protein